MLLHELNEIYLELSDTCNLTCKHCSSSAYPAGKTLLKIENIIRLLEEGRDMGAACVTLSGGEPFIYPHLYDILSYCSLLNYTVRIYTSGVLKDEHRIIPANEMLFEKLASYNNIDSIIFSLHGSDAATHDYVTNTKGSFSIVVEAIKNANDFGLPIEIHTVPLSVNYRQIPDIIHFAEEYSVKQVSLLRLVPQGRCLQNEHLIMDMKQTDEFIKIIEGITPGLLNLRKGAPFKCLFFCGSECSAGKNKVLVGPDGSVFPCEAFKSKRAYSNINTDSLHNIWCSDPRLNKIRKLNDTQVLQCKDCYYMPRCHGGCPGQRDLKYNNFFVGPDPICISF